jgi:hypothetical protein
LDFTINTYKKLLGTLITKSYTFQTFTEFLEKPVPRSIIMRHDVDLRPEYSLRFAIIQNELGLKGSYYFRMAPGSFNEAIVREIAGLEHEIGYHYEDMDLAKLKFKVKSSKFKEEDLYDPAIEIFQENLDKFRKLYPVTTICMHGSPLSKYDNRDLWKKYDYREFGIIGEPYFDLDFSKVMYLTDTGRRWDGKGSVRDKVSGRQSAVGSQQSVVSSQQSAVNGSSDFPPTADRRPPTNHAPGFRHTKDIIAAANAGLLPDQIMFTFHPQRWTDRSLPWLRELVMQNVKNVAKRWIVKREV